MHKNAFAARALTQTQLGDTALPKTPQLDQWRATGWSQSPFLKSLDYGPGFKHYSCTQYCQQLSQMTYDMIHDMIGHCSENIKRLSSKQHAHCHTHEQSMQNECSSKRGVHCAAVNFYNTNATSLITLTSLCSSNPIVVNKNQK